MGRKRWRRKVTKGLAMPPPMAIRRFWGLPIGLITLPVVTAKDRVSSSTRPSIRCLPASRSMSGVPTIARVSFISRADARPTPNSTASTRESALRARPRV